MIRRGEEGPLKPLEAIREQHAEITRVRRGRLFRRYFLLILALVCGALLISGAIGLYFSYQENKGALASLQHEKALSAAARIEQFVLQIEQQLSYAALPQLGVEGLEQRRIEFLKLLRVVHAVTDITQIDGNGREQLSVSRLKMDEAGTGRDWSQEPAFKNARPGRTWYGPVYFRKETEPYMSIAVRSGGAAGAVTVAEVNLKFIWDVVTRIRVGQKGKAYVVDSAGQLVADPDIGLVLRKTSMSHLEQVQAALKPDADDTLAMLAKDLAGHRVLTAWAPIEPARDQPLQGAAPTPLGWKVFVEQPVSEVFQALNATILRTAVLIVAGLLFSALAAMWLARSMARPIGVLQEGAQRIGAGDLDARIDVRTGDELESLADRFNDMTARLRESYAGLERKVEERTAELKQALDFQQASGEILASISGSISDTQPVFNAIVRNLTRLFGTHYSVVQLIRDGKIELAAFTGEPEFEAIRRFYPQPLDSDSITGRVVLGRQVLQIASVTKDPLAPARSRKLAAELGYEGVLGAPMIREDKVIGAIVTAHRLATTFDEKQVALIKAFADQAVIAIENARLVNETREALEKQTATAEILRVLSSSPADTQPVFDAIARNAARLCDSVYANVFRYDGERLHLAASEGAQPGVLASLKRSYPMPPNRSRVVGRVIESRRVVRVEDTAADPDYDKAFADTSHHRRILGVPLLRAGEPVGAITVGWDDPGPILPRHEDLLKTFADQAVIAIENVRLFNETKEALEQQTATSEILKVISSSTTDTQPVFDAIVQSGLKLFPDAAVAVTRPEGGKVHLAAIASVDPAHIDAWKRRFPFPLSREYMHAVAILDRKLIDVPDAAANRDPSIAAGIANFLASGSRAMTVMPMLRGDTAIGAISVVRREPGPLGDKQLALLRTFADQAVIAIENVRLFNETKEALEQQTATSEILKVISSSTTDTQPVFEAIVHSAAQLFSPCNAFIFMRDGARVRLLAMEGVTIDQAIREHITKIYPVPFDPGVSSSARAMAERRINACADTEAPDVAEHIRQAGRAGRFRSNTVVPLIREDEGIGTIVLTHPEPGYTLTEKQLTLLRTFADQAVIAIANVRLFNETKESLDRQTAISEVLRVISSSPSDVQPTLDAVAARAARLCDAAAVALYTLDGASLRRAAFSGPAELHGNDTLPFSPGTLTGRTIAEGKAIHIENLEREQGEFPLSWELGQRYGRQQSMLAVPLMREGRPFGTMFLRRTEVRPFTEKQIALATTFADQAAIAIQNARLFREIQEKSAQLEIANKHKSEFLANMSHELRTPLNAIIGFSEVLMEKMFGEINPKQLDYLKDIHESGKHLLSLINDILDLSKIEAGRMDLELSSFHLPTALSNAMTLVRERAQRHAIQLGLQVDPRLGEFQADERKVKQILVNLLSNAVKFTPDGGRVDVSAKLDTSKVEIAVRDTGIGIAPEDQALVFEEFKQVGRDYTRKAEGTGLGLALTRRFVELHGGEIRLASEPGKGSTFTVTLPIRD